MRLLPNNETLLHSKNFRRPAVSQIQSVLPSQRLASHPPTERRDLLTKRESDRSRWFKRTQCARLPRDSTRPANAQDVRREGFHCFAIRCLPSSEPHDETGGKFRRNAKQFERHPFILLMQKDEESSRGVAILPRRISMRPVLALGCPASHGIKRPSPDPPCRKRHSHF